MSDELEFGALLRATRTNAGCSLRDLASRIRFNHGYIGKVEQGEKFPHEQFAQLADRTLTANGALVAAWKATHEHKQRAEQVGRLLVASTQDSLRLISSDEELLDLGDLDHETRQLAVDYLTVPPAPMLQKGVELRSEALRRLRQRHYRREQLADLYLMIGRIQGVLAYAALDLGDPNAAMTHAGAGWSCAERADDNELRAWTRGTQSLVSRFSGSYQRASDLVLDGLQYKTRGTSRIRLICGYAQCQANLGDSHQANHALDRALDEREELASTDSLKGIYEFSEAKQHYYASSSLIWVNGASNAERAAKEAHQAIELWQHEQPERRSLDDEALAHVYLGTAYLQLAQLDAATDAVRNVLDLPAERQISWIRKRLGRFAGMLRDQQYRTSADATALYEEIQTLNG